MPLANVALTDTFDYWRTVTNSLVVALDSTLVLCNTSNANTVSIPRSISRSSNLYVNILTSSSLSDTASGNVASALVVNTVHSLLLTTAAASNNWANTVGTTVALSSNNWANTKLSNTSGMSFAGSLSIPGSLTISTNNFIDTNGGRFRTGAGNFGVRIFPGGGTDTSASILQFTNAAQDTQWGSVVANGQFMYVGTQAGAGPLWFGTVGTTGLAIDTSNRVGIGTVSPAATLDVVGTVSIAKASVLSQTLTDGATINWDTSLGQVATITLGGNRTIAAPTNLKVGTYILHIIQDGVGGRTLSWNSVFKWPAGVAPTLTTTANRRDLFSFVCDGTNLYGSFLPDVR